MSDPPSSEEFSIILPHEKPRELTNGVPPHSEPLERHRRLVPARLMSRMPAGRAGQRVVLNALVNSLGNGVFIASSTLYFLRFTSIDAAQIGVGLLVGGVLGVLSSVPMGRLADRFGAVEVLAAANVWRAVATLAYLWVHDFSGYVAVTALLLVVDRAAPPLDQAVVADLVREQDRTRVLAFMRTVTNVGYFVGFGLAGVVIAAGKEQGFRVMFVLDAATFLFVAVRLWGLRTPNRRVRVQGSQAVSGGERRVPSPWGDVRVLAMTGTTAILFLYDRVLLVAMPVWISEHTTAPTWLLTAMLTTSTVLVVIFQIPSGRLVADYVSAVRLVTVSSCLLAVACTLLFLSGHPWPSSVVAMLLMASLLGLTGAELLHTTGAWHLGLTLAHPRARARYLSFIGQGYVIEETAGPAFLLLLISSAGSSAWLVVGAMVIAAGALHQAVLGSQASRRSIPATQ